ncbi:hypothetical protein EDD80_11525 [Anseongella ginsenosidimutans]|uniref:Uncharacterized protein n=1 Tax=Anseongella ginsenosidimutans TaxID=496056 RepID=A0A4R3KLX1_9SPHI|nr:hypothetical protein EDD80_11525 [Anseongella ginsenosidimutans]
MLHNRNIIDLDFLTFKEKLFDLACFSTDQVYAWQPDFDRNNLTRWIRKGYLVRLRQGITLFLNSKVKKIIPYTSPTGFTSLLISACILHWRFTE